MTNKIYEKISKELTLQQKWKDGEWLLQQLACKRISLFQLKYLEIHSRLIEEVYPDKWDMIITANNNDNKKLKIKFEPVIKFENLVINNTRKQSIPLKSIFVKIPFNYSEKYYIDKIRGMRNIISYNEYTNSYAHSHLSSVDYKKYNLSFEQFCTGSGEINLLNIKLRQQFNEPIYKTLLFHLKGYLEWESLEGTPYISIKDLFIKSKNNDLPYLEYDSIKIESNTRIKRNIEYPSIRKKLDWIIKDNKYEIKDNEKLEDYCRTYGKVDTKDQIISYYKDLYYYKDEQNNYYPIDSTIEDIVINKEAWFPFQGKKEVMQVEGLLENQETEVYYIHPKIKEHVKRQLEQAINNKFNKDSAIRQLQD